MATRIPPECPLPTADQERFLVDYVRQRCGRGKRLRSYIAFLLYLFFGVRRGMVTKVDRADVCLEHSKITLTFNKQRGGKRVRITFDMPPLLKAAVEEFLNLPGQPEFKITTIARLLHSAALAAGMANLTPKTFRKLFITRALQKGVDVATIALIVGHNDDGRSILHNYNQYCPEHINAGVKKVNAAYLDLGDPDWVETQRQRARRDTDVIVETRRDVAAAALQFLDKLQEKIQEQQYDAVLRMVRLPDGGLPSEPSEQLPSVPKLRPLSEALQIAANLRALFWKKGLGYNEDRRCPWPLKIHHLRYHAGHPPDDRRPAKAGRPLRRGCEGFAQPGRSALQREAGTGQRGFAGPSLRRYPTALLRVRHQCGRKRGISRQAT